jgi:hypothetical protein
VTQSDPALDRARRHVKQVRDFAYHLMTYVFVNAMLVAIDLQAEGANRVLGLDWAYWVVIAWGFGLVGHAVFVFFGEHRVQKVYERMKDRDAGER